MEIWRLVSQCLSVRRLNSKKLTRNMDECQAQFELPRLQDQRSNRKYIPRCPLNRKMFKHICVQFTPLCSKQLVGPRPSAEPRQLSCDERCHTETLEYVFFSRQNMQCFGKVQRSYKSCKFNLYTWLTQQTGFVTSETCSVSIGLCSFSNCNDAIVFKFHDNKTASCQVRSHGEPSSVALTRVVAPCPCTGMVSAFSGCGGSDKARLVSFRGLQLATERGKGKSAKCCCTNLGTLFGSNFSWKARLSWMSKFIAVVLFCDLL